jgi:hypothetical protein
LQEIRRNLAETRGPGEAVRMADCQQFNTLLAAARPERPRDVLLLGVRTVDPEAELTYGELLEAYERIELALGERPA